MKNSGQSLSCFFPCYNDAKTIGHLVEEAYCVASEYTSDFEIIVVDDGSTDGSREILCDLKNHHPHLKLIFHKKNKGYGGALLSGFQTASKDLIFYTDGDGQYDVGELRNLLNALQPDTDVVNGYKIKRSDPFYRIAIGAIYLQMMRVLFNFKIRDVDCDFRLIRRSVLNQISLHHTSGVICVELVKKLEMIPCRFIEIPVHHFHRQHGSSQFFVFRRLFKTGIDIFLLWIEMILTPALRKLLFFLPRNRA